MFLHHIGPFVCPFTTHGEIYWPFDLPYQLQKWGFHNWVFWKGTSFRDLKMYSKKLYPLQP
jgi:hypothetical protein